MYYIQYLESCKDCKQTHTYLKLKIQNNGLKSQNESLKSTIQDELYKTFMNKLGEPQEIERLKKENSWLKAENEALTADDILFK